MIVISSYLKNVHNTKEDINEILGETISSMRFLSMFLTPLVAGVTVTMAVVIIQILSQLGAAVGGLLTTTGDVSMASSLLIVPWALGGTPPISPPIFQLVVGFYMLETAILLAIFLNGVQYGEDAVGKRNSIWTILLFGTIIYALSWFITFSIFGGSIAQILTPVV